MNNQQNPNLDILRMVIDQLGELADKMIFLGGCAAGLLITDTAAPPVRVTKDVDTIVQVTTKADYYRLAAKLRTKGFNEDSRKGAPLCRWVAGSIMLDVMPTDPSILGFGNAWYESASRDAVTFGLDSGRAIQLISAPYFLITKLIAFVCILRIPRRGKNTKASKFPNCSILGRWRVQFRPGRTRLFHISY